MSASPAPYDVQDFERDVVEASHTTPVLVDFWAPWCAPCRLLSPVLERVAGEAGGRWTLRMVNADDYPELMQRYHIRGIPAVKLFVGGEVAAGFEGAMPDYAIRQWLDEHLPTAATRAMAEARTALKAGDLDAARPHLETAAAPEAHGPAADEARDTLARILVFEDPDRAAALVRDRYTPEAESVRTLARLLALDPDSLPEGAARTTYADAVRALQRGDLDAALPGFIQALQHDRAYDDDGARKAAVALFQTLGEADALVKQHRPAFNMALY